MAPRPSRLAGRDSNVTTCCCCKRSSAASSMVTIRSLSGIKEESTFSVVVLPEPVPPDTIIFKRAFTQASRNSAISSLNVPKPTKLSMESGFFVNLRIVTQGPISDNGGTMALTREPSARRASTRGDASSIRLPKGDTMRSIIFIKWASSWNCTLVSCNLPLRSTNIFLGPLIITSVMLSSFSKGSIGPRPKISSQISATIRARSPRGTLMGLSSNTLWQ